LRCAFHGWLFDVNGKCLQTPAEPDDSNLCANIKQKSYPVVEKSGILFAYLGPASRRRFRNSTASSRRRRTLSRSRA
jgi:phenylpropionate dioxygenase-like ring-hydroxylating dioxygenase large terminal subunit